MSIFNAIALIGGLALFLYGMNLLGEGLSKTSGGKLESILEKLTSNPITEIMEIMLRKKYMQVTMVQVS